MKVPLKRPFPFGSASFFTNTTQPYLDSKTFVIVGRKATEIANLFRPVPAVIRQSKS